MTVIVEYVLLDNFLFDFLLAYLVSCIIKIKKLPIVLSALLGCTLALIYPIIPEKYSVLYKLFTLFVSVLPLCIKQNLKKSIGITVIYISFSALLSGLIYLFLDGKLKGVIFYNEGGKVAVISACAITGTYFIKQIIGIIKNKAVGKFVKIKLSDGKKTVSADGFFDSGNQCQFNGEGVNFLSKRLSSKLQMEEIGKIELETVNGKSIESVYQIKEIEIYSKNTTHIFTNVKAVKTNRTFNGFEILMSYYFSEDKQ